MRSLILALAGAAAAAPLAAHADPAPPVAARQEARIPFVAFGTIRHFEPVGKNLVYLQDRRRRWYRAELAAASNSPMPIISASTLAAGRSSTGSAR